MNFPRIQPGLIITYPPEHDGELHIQTDLVRQQNGFIIIRYTFDRSTKDEATPGHRHLGVPVDAAWRMLVDTAVDILAQDKRRR